MKRSRIVSQRNSIRGDELPPLIHTTLAVLPTRHFDPTISDQPSCSSTPPPAQNSERKFAGIFFFRVILCLKKTILRRKYSKTREKPRRVIALAKDARIRAIWGTEYYQTRRNRTRRREVEQLCVDPVARSESSSSSSSSSREMLAHQLAVSITSCDKKCTALIE